MTATRQSSHILIASSRLGESFNMKCEVARFVVMFSLVLLRPKGLLQRMQQNGSSAFRTRAGAVAARKSICGLSEITFSGQVALHSPHCTQASSAKRKRGRSKSSVSAPVGQAATHDRHK